MFGLREYLQARYRECAVWPLWARWAMPAERPMLLLVGRRGAGKTLLASKIAYGRMRDGEPVYANYPVSWGDADAGGSAGRIYSLLDCLDLTGCTIIIDEANMWCDSRSWQSIPTEVRGSWQQSRKSGVSFIFTAQHESRVDTVIRELVDFLLVCERVPLVPRWFPLFRYHRTWIEEVTEIRSGKTSRALLWYAGRRILGSYDTRALVDPLALARLRDYQKAVKAAKKPEEVRMETAAVIAPLRWSAGVVESYDGTAWVSVP
jgi:SpoVK/Ycf46/Vps4 family AAA+-type ATPase